MYLARSSPTVLTWFMDASLSGLQRPHSGTPRPPGASTPSQPRLVQGADLIGQLGDPLYLKKANALFYEFEEIGLNRQLGYASPADLVERYPDFYWNSVSPHLKEAIDYLNVTAAGRQWIANLHSHVFCAEHAFALMGPQR